jgi:DNA-binding MarR family transcriptional regulator
MAAKKTPLPAASSRKGTVVDRLRRAAQAKIPAKSPKTGPVEVKSAVPPANIPVLVPKSPTPKQLAALEDGLVAYKYRVEGYSIHEVAEMMQLPPSQVSTLIRDTLKLILASHTESAEEARRIEVDRLEAFQRRALHIANNIDPELALAGVNSGIKVSKAKRDLLGLDAATKMEVNHAGDVGMRVYPGVNIEDI